MKREEKNLQSRQRIMESALREFAEQGYGLSSINTICKAGKIPKGVLYHYFKDKDEVYLTCVRECFDKLTAYLSSHVALKKDGTRDTLQDYFDARLDFFRENPPYQRLFLEAVLSPPAHLSSAIAESKAGFDALNDRAFDTLLEHLTLRPDMTKSEVIEIFRQYQDFVNATTSPDDTGSHERRSRRAVSVLLYGVTARGKNETP